MKSKTAGQARNAPRNCPQILLGGLGHRLHVGRFHTRARVLAEPTDPTQRRRRYDPAGRTAPPRC